MRLFLLLPLLLGFSVPAMAHNEANSGEVGVSRQVMRDITDQEGAESINNSGREN